MGPGIYSEIGKKCRDLLWKDYSYDQKISVSTYSDAGVKMIRLLPSSTVSISSSIIESWTPSTLGLLLSSCAKERLLNPGRSIHAIVLKRDCWWWSTDLYVKNHILNFYAKCEKIEWAKKLFDEMPRRNTVTWTALISGYDQCWKSNKALEMFSLMISESFDSRPNEFTYASAITACAKQEHFKQGMQVHSHALRRGFISYILVSNVLISFYMACGYVPEAQLIFREIPEPDQVSWNSLVSGLSQNRFLQATLETFQRLRESVEKISSFALSTAIAACLEDETDGKRLHCFAVKIGLNSEDFTGCAMIRMYSKFGNMEGAVEVFRELGFKDVASWNSLIEGYAESNQGELGMQVFYEFMESELKPDEITMTAIMGICTNLALLHYGKQVHSLGLKTSLDRRTRVENSLIDMYSKCGNLEDGIKVFRFMEEKTLVSWTTMMGGLAHHGRANEVIELFEEMKKEGLKPNKVTYTCVLSACSHGGLLDLGRAVFKTMEIEPESEHFICMVHMLAGGGRLDEAKELIRKSAVENRDLLWHTFLVACKNLGELQRGVELAEKIIKEGFPAESFTLVLLSNVFAAAGRWEEVRKLREEMSQRGIRKQPGCSWIEVE